MTHEGVPGKIAAKCRRSLIQWRPKPLKALCAFRAISTRIGRLNGLGGGSLLSSTSNPWVLALEFS